MFDTEKFIFEVQNRACLWDYREKPVITERKRAWEEIAKLFNENWDDETEAKKREIVEELQKKWKHLRDYYVKEKKKSGNEAPKKRKNSCVELLQFLDVVKVSLPKGSTQSGSPVRRRIDENSNSSSENDIEKLNSEVVNIKYDEYLNNRNEYSEEDIYITSTHHTTSQIDQNASSSSGFLVPITHPIQKEVTCKKAKAIDNAVAKLDEIANRITGTVNSIAEKKDDEFDIFGKYIALTLRSLPKGLAIMGKTEIQKAIMDIQLREMSENIDVKLEP